MASDRVVQRVVRALQHADRRSHYAALSRIAGHQIPRGSLQIGSRQTNIGGRPFCDVLNRFLENDASRAEELYKDAHTILAVFFVFTAQRCIIMYLLQFLIEVLHRTLKYNPHVATKAMRKQLRSGVQMSRLVNHLRYLSERRLLDGSRSLRAFSHWSLVARAARSRAFKLSTEGLAHCLNWWEQAVGRVPSPGRGE